MRNPWFLTLLIFVTFLLFQPRIPNLLSKNLRQNYFGHFIDNTTQANHLDPQTYWETREFYYPGVFYVFEDGLSSAHVEDFSQKTKIKLKRDLDSFPILVYDSPVWSSYEALVNTDKIEEIVSVVGDNLIYQDDETTIYKDGNTTYVYFIKQYDELKITNGFIYTKDKILKNYNYWFGVSVVTE